MLKIAFLHICFHNFRYTRERKFYSDRGLPCPKDQALEEENDKKEEEHEPNTPGENIRLFDKMDSQYQISSKILHGTKVIIFII